MKSEYRKIAEGEIRKLVTNNCECDDWSTIFVTDRFHSCDIRNCRFGGHVYIGNYVTISGVREIIKNYEIEDDVEIRNVETIITEGESTFGNGITVNVLNETGGREVKLSDKLTSQIAYITAMYRHRPKLIIELNKAAEKYAKSKKSSIGIIQNGAIVKNCGLIKNVNIGECAQINGAAELVEGTVNSSCDAPTLIGRGVIAREFITATSITITDFVNLKRCFVGQGCEIGCGFSAEHTLFFANSVCMNGEACAVFAGPYTVTHHKSSLLIGGMFSYYNAGSGTNQSNHMYRLGAVHQGVLERGVKTSSSSYILFPARIGAFSIVKGRHYSNPDTSEFPFSYLIESEERSLLIPAANLATAGTARDSAKWNKRDNRSGNSITDILNNKSFTPYTIEKIATALSILKSFKHRGKNDIQYKNFYIKGSYIKRAIEIYSAAIDRYVGEVYFKATISTSPVYDNWVDISGLIAPTECVEQILDEIESGKISGYDNICCAFNLLHDNYEDYERAYISKFIEDKTKVKIKHSLQKSTTYLNNLIKEDTEKEFSDRAKISYGIDNESVATKDFNAVRKR